MKKLQVYKSAIDFAYGNIGNTDPAALDIAAAQEFQKQELNSLDYQYWRQSVTNALQQFRALSNQQLNSELVKPKIVEATKPA